MSSPAVQQVGVLVSAFSDASLDVKAVACAELLRAAVGSPQSVMDAGGLPPLMSLLVNVRTVAAHVSPLDDLSPRVGSIII